MGAAGGGWRPLTGSDGLSPPPAVTFANGQLRRPAALRFRLYLSAAAAGPRGRRRRILVSSGLTAALRAAPAPGRQSTDGKGSASPEPQRLGLFCRCRTRSGCPTWGVTSAAARGGAARSAGMGTAPVLPSNLAQDGRCERRAFRQRGAVGSSGEVTSLHVSWLRKVPLVALGQIPLGS